MDKINLYTKANGKALVGLTTRRKAERVLFLTEVNISTKALQAATVQNTYTTDSFMFKITADSLRIRKGAGTNYEQVGSIKDKGVYTITKTQDNWGYLKSGAGWICLDYTKRI